MTQYIIKPGIGKFDDVYSKIIVHTLPFWHSIGFTPNHLTTLGLISSLLCVLFIWMKKVVPAVLFLILRMYFDYADGLLARKYKQATRFGDWYDHAVDIFGFAIPLIIVILTSTRPKLVFPVVILMVLCSVNIACVEKRYHKETGSGGDSLLLISRFCFAEEVFKYIDSTVLYLGLIIIIIILCRAKKVS